MIPGRTLKSNPSIHCQLDFGKETTIVIQRAILGRKSTVNTSIRLGLCQFFKVLCTSDMIVSKITFPKEAYTMKRSRKQKQNKQSECNLIYATKGMVWKHLTEPQEEKGRLWKNS